MTAIDSAEVINELESECECAREVLAAMQEQRDSARSVAVALEQEVYLGEWLFAELRWAFRSES